MQAYVRRDKGGAAYQLYAPVAVDPYFGQGYLLIADNFSHYGIVKPHVAGGAQIEFVVFPSQLKGVEVKIDEVEQVRLQAAGHRGR